MRSLRLKERRRVINTLGALSSLWPKLGAEYSQTKQAHRKEPNRTKILGNDPTITPHELKCVPQISRKQPICHDCTSQVIREQRRRQTYRLSKIAEANQGDFQMR